MFPIKLTIAGPTLHPLLNQPLEVPKLDGAKLVFNFIE
tara:strand:- start:1672 stop:1785 length:114 start_codon:yes stop_codon:yes gene_type:complete